MKVYLFGAEVDQVLICYIRAFHYSDSIIIVGDVGDNKILRALDAFNVEYTKDNSLYMGVGDVRDYSDGVILSGNGCSSVFNYIFNKNLDSYAFTIKNPLTGDSLTNISLFESFSKISKNSLRLYGSMDVYKSLRIVKPELIKLFYSDIMKMELCNSVNSSRVYFDVINKSLVPQSSNFEECNKAESGYDFYFDCSDIETFNRFDRRFLRNTVSPITSIKIVDTGLPDVNFVTSFPYNLMISVDEVNIPSADGEFEIVLKDFVYNCIKCGVKAYVYISSDSEDIINQLIYLGYPIEFIKTWRFNYE